MKHLLKNARPLRWASSLIACVGKHKSACAVAVGLATIGAGAVVTVIETKRSLDELDEALDETMTESEAVKTKAFVIAKHALVPVLLFVGGGVSIIFAHRTDAKTIAALSAALQISDSTLADYKKSVVDKVGSSQEAALAENTAESFSRKRAAVTDAYEGSSNAVFTGTGDTLMFEPYTNTFFYSDVESIRKAVNDCNHDLIGGCYENVSLDDLYNEINLKVGALGEMFGWRNDDLIKLNFSSALTAANEPYITIGYASKPALIRDILY